MPHKKEDEINLLNLIRIATNAGTEILGVYDSEDIALEIKDDDSPLTLADKKSHEVIAASLQKEHPTIPLLSEEGTHLPYHERKEWDYFWVVDPLDGTKEFVKRNGEFTVNIALVHKNVPLIGAIYVPVWDTVYFAKKGLGAYKLENCKEVLAKEAESFQEKAEKLPLAQERKGLNVVASRSHMSEDTKQFVKELEKEAEEVNIVSAGSSLKFCLVAEGKADVYPRFAPTMEWDTAAGHAIVEEAGGKVTKQDGTPLLYNKEELVNPWFVVERKKENVVGK
ncbi:3'(2'),5'-bisphosphate nucleotidase CysQ [Priestia filamentosa]|uniref:3'(2'),5'-bisphosphate nucleotidase CysQ n=1 Tax=Priestia filamentosa TaxID=1402861 RepID=UPI0002DEF1E2|nr:3'(2'),5'-bisphosphate nucleotidase CysQ [Priestia filamentosa]